MKIFELNSYFKLPDNFDGTLDDAFNLLFEYRKIEKKTIN
jgi:hypothetical protein